ncbi:enoyl-CoA hydratase-related protein [Thalassobacillus sp. CUG 92003]|uniref:enoyl-CoA hydratase-related protein n=1 Tax=Thalassobacillus sp. CUG 92003 TaxID=2736641 RepID=UPI0015E6F85A|nr:enoyl-CoA hydratase-related protein [Thalassobacillus sp. CUG 92003]
MKLTLNREHAANALSRDMLDSLNVKIDELEKDEQLRALIITGSGEKAFCAGADLKERSGMSEHEVVKTVEWIGQTISRIEKLPMPTIAMINGVAFGGGLELALACDIRMMNESAKLGLTETSLGIIPGAGGTQRLSRLIGLGKAKELIFTAKPVTAKQAFSIGLVEYTFPPEVLAEETEKLAFTIGKNAPIALRQAKKAIQYGAQSDLDTALNIERLCYQATIPTQDRLEGINAFKEKRTPVYRGE